MGTSAIIKVKDEGVTLACIQVTDSGGRWMGTFLSGMLRDSKIVHGMGFLDKCPAVFNGAGCLAAFLVSSLKSDFTGKTYLLGRAGRNDADYYYQLTITKELKMKLEVWARDQMLYNGPFEGFNPEVVYNMHSLVTQTTV